MLIKEIIENYIRQNNAVAFFLKETGADCLSFDETLPLFIEKLKETSYNPELGTRFTGQLLMAENEELYNQYELEDIRMLLNSLLVLQKTNIEAYLDAANFEYGIMDNNVRAKEIVTEGIVMTKEKLAALELLLTEIEDDEAST